MLPRPILTQLAPLRSLTARHLRPAPSSSSPISMRQTWARFSSQQQQQPPQQKQQSLNGKFYATFGRPIFKTILIAILTYQFAYYAWIRLEHHEIKADMNATILNLEARIVQLEREQQP
ncbi:hypothetical protein F4809DRAFT_609517 [Biscogniauxia mediterranea]|nr:hypothetical protein F4809DRAFT_609517 [Biscogniauxia mediterranea]